MTYRLTAVIVLTVFISLAVFGLYIPVHAGHGMGCPFSLGETALCASTFAHIEHWRSALVAVLLQLLTMIGAVLIIFAVLLPAHPRDHQAERFRSAQHSRLRPLLMQELFAAGILNRKAP